MESQEKMAKNYSAREVATILNVSVFTVHKLLKDKLLGGFKITKLWRIPEADLDKFMKRSRNVS